MARRGRGRRMASSGSLDSFLDIVTNSLGLLILVALLSAFSAQGVKVSLGTPIMTDADASMEVVQFQVVNGRIIPVDMDYWDPQIDQFFTPTSDQQSLAMRFNAEGLSNGFHTVEFKPGEPGLFGIGGSFALTPIADDTGDEVAALDDPSSEFVTRIGELDPDQQWVYFLVSSESFEEFREFREYVKQQGFEVGWMPYQNGRSLEFGPGGRAARIG